MNILSGLNFKRHRKTLIFHVGKGKCLVRATQREMSFLQDKGQKWNTNESKVIYVRKGKQVEHAANLKLDETTLVEKLKTVTKYKFLGVRVRDGRREISIYSCSKDVFAKALNNLDKPSVRRQPRQATNQFALLVLTYPMWTQQWPLRKLQTIDRETRKLISENGGRHPLSSTALLKQTSNQTRQYWSSMSDTDHCKKPTLRLRPSTSSWV